MGAPKEVNLSTICGGAAAEVFDREFREVLKNIDDPNTAPDANRKITLIFDIKPMPDRSGAAVTFSCGSKLAPIAVVKSTIFLSRDGGVVKAYGADVRQQAMFNEPEKTPRLEVLKKS